MYNSQSTYSVSYKENTFKQKVSEGHFVFLLSEDLRLGLVSPEDVELLIRLDAAVDGHK